MRIKNYNAPFWRWLRKYKGHILLAIFLTTLVFTTSIMLLKSIEIGLENEELYWERVYQEHEELLKLSR